MGEGRISQINDIDQIFNKIIRKIIFQIKMNNVFMQLKEAHRIPNRQDQKRTHGMS